MSKCKAFAGTREIVRGENSHGISVKFETAMHHTCKKESDHQDSHECEWCSLSWGNTPALDLEDG